MDSIKNSKLSGGSVGDKTSKSQGRQIITTSKKVVLFFAIPLTLSACSAASPAASFGSGGSASTVSPAAKIRPGLGLSGFSHITDSVSIPANTATTFKDGNITVTIPANAISKEVVFQVLQSKNSYWQKKVSNKEKVISNFAFRIIDPRNKELIYTLGAPLTVSVTSPAIVPGARYLSVIPSTPPKIAHNSIPSSINLKQHSLTYVGKSIRTGSILVF